MYYMFIASGSKHWQLIHPRHLTVAEPIVQSLGEMNHPERYFNLSAPDEIVDVENNNNKYYFDIYCGTIHAGDLIMLPAGWLHRVWTGDDENTIGLVGYNFMEYPNWEEDVDFAMAEQEENFRHLDRRRESAEKLRWF
jgi:cupin superfamily acireductone dioxygenase involved in methionine salvage